MSLSQEDIAEITRVIRKIVREEVADLEVATKLTINRGVVTGVENGTGMQELQCTALAEETLDEVESFQADGFMSYPATGSETCLATVGDDRAHMIALGTNNRDKRAAAMAAVSVNAPPEPGDTVMYGPDGQFLHYWAQRGWAFHFVKDGGGVLFLGGFGAFPDFNQPVSLQDKTHQLVEKVGAALTAWANALPVGPLTNVHAIAMALAVVTAVNRPWGVPPGGNTTQVGAGKVWAV